MSSSPILRGLALSFGLTVLFSVTITAEAQQPSAQVSPEMARQADAMVPMIAQMTRATLQSSLDFYAQPATAKAFASFTKNYLDALVTVGFTRDEALRIVAAHGLPALHGVGR